MATSPTQRSLKYLREQGYTVAVTEKWNPHARIRLDLFGFVDLLAIKEGQTLAIQTTSASNFADRRAKILEHDNLSKVLSAGWSVHVHGWRKNVKGNRVLKLGEVNH
jgi:hypothetical protein